MKWNFGYHKSCRLFYCFCGIVSCSVKVPSGAIHDVTDFTPNKGRSYTRSFWMQFLHPSNCFSDGKYWPKVHPSHLEDNAAYGFLKDTGNTPRTHQEGVSCLTLGMENCWQCETIPFVAIRNSLSPLLFTLELFKREYFQAILRWNYQLTILVIELSV